MVRTHIASKPVLTARGNRPTVPRPSLLGLILALAAGQVWAGPPDDAAAMQVDALVRRALETEPALAAAMARARAARAAAPVPRAPMDPMIETEIMAGADMVTAEVMASQGLMPPGALRAGRAMGDARAEAEEARALGEALALEATVRAAAAMLGGAQERVRVLGASRQAALGLVDSARAMTAAGMVPSGDIAMAEMEVAEIDGRMAAAAGEEAMARASLERLVGEAPVAVPLVPLPPNPVREDPPMLVAMAAMARMADAEEGMARAERLPPLIVKVGVALQPEPLGGDMAIVGLSTTLPTFYAKKQGARLASAAAAAEAAGDDQDAARREIDREQAGMAAELDALRERVAAAERMRWAALAAADAAVAGYTAGTRDLEALLLAQQRQRQAAEMEAMLRAEALTTHARLAAMLGVSLLEVP